MEQTYLPHRLHKNFKYLLVYFTFGGTNNMRKEESNVRRLKVWEKYRRKCFIKNNKEIIKSLDVSALQNPLVTEKEYEPCYLTS